MYFQSRIYVHVCQNKCFVFVFEEGSGGDARGVHKHQGGWTKHLEETSKALPQGHFSPKSMNYNYGIARY